jgi:hypothetical protein
MERIKPWLEGGGAGDSWFKRWSPDPKYAD